MGSVPGPIEAHMEMPTALLTMRRQHLLPGPKFRPTSVLYPLCDLGQREETNCPQAMRANIALKLSLARARSSPSCSHSQSRASWAGKKHSQSPCLRKQTGQDGAGQGEAAPDTQQCQVQIRSGVHQQTWLLCEAPGARPEETWILKVLE